MSSHIFWLRATTYRAEICPIQLKPLRGMHNIFIWVKPYKMTSIKAKNVGKAHDRWCPNLLGVTQKSWVYVETRTKVMMRHRENVHKIFLINHEWDSDIFGSVKTISFSRYKSITQLPHRFNHFSTTQHEVHSYKKEIGRCIYLFIYSLKLLIAEQCRYLEVNYAV